jgi:flagellar M-ring protein FliF
MSNWLEILSKQLNGFWEGLSGNHKKILIVAVIGFILIGIMSAFIIGQTRYAVLYSGLDAQEASEIFTRLQELDVQPRLQGVSTIMVPEEREAELRMQLTAEGYPKSGFNFNIFANGGGLGQFGQTDEDQRIMLMMQLQERLSESIKFLDSVEDAVVNIAMPETDQFVLKDQQIPVTASVIIEPVLGQQISAVQAENIEQLVARSVPGLKPENITIIDRNANVLNRRQEENMPSDQFHLEYQMEDRLKNQVVNLLEPVFGLGRVVSKVNVKLNFDKQVTESVRFEPVVDDSGIIISREALRERMTDTQSGGVVGETPNVTQYPVVADGGEGTFDKRHEIVNYEVNEIKERLERQQGQIEDLSISVIIDNEEMDEQAIGDVKELVATAVGTDLNRIAVHAMKFDVTLQEAFLEGFERRQVGLPIDMNMFMIAAFVVIFAVVAFMIMRRQRIITQQEAMKAALETGTAQIEIEEVDLEKNTQDQIKKQLDKLAMQRPDALAQLLRNWLTEE